MTKYHPNEIIKENSFIALNDECKLIEFDGISWLYDWARKFNFLLFSGLSFIYRRCLFNAYSDSGKKKNRESSISLLQVLWFDLELPVMASKQPEHVFLCNLFCAVSAFNVFRSHHPLLLYIPHPSWIVNFFFSTVYSCACIKYSASTMRPKRW